MQLLMMSFVATHVETNGRHHCLNDSRRKCVMYARTRMKLGAKRLLIRPGQAFVMMAALGCAAVPSHATASMCRLMYEQFFAACRGDRCNIEFRRVPGRRGTASCTSYMETRAVDPRLASVLGEMVTQLRPTQREGIYALYIPRTFGDYQSGDEFSDFGERADDWFRLVDPVQPKDRWADLSPHDQVSRLLRNARSDSLHFQSADVSDRAVSALRSDFERQEKDGLTSHRLQWASFWSLVVILAAATICTTRAFFRHIQSTNNHQMLTSITGWPVLAQLGLVATGMSMVIRQDAYSLLALLVPVVLLILLAEMSAMVIVMRRRRQQP